MDICGHPMLWWVLEAAKKIPGVDSVVCAIPDNEPALWDWLHKETDVLVHRGPATDVLKRYCQAARRARADIVVRVTGDCPLLDPEESGRALEAYLTSRD